MFQFKGFCGNDQSIFIAKVFTQEIENHVTSLAVIAGVHGHLTKEILTTRHDDSQCTKSVPKIVKGKDGLAVGTGRLIFECDERTSQLNGVRHVVLDELIGEVEHVAGSKDRLSFLIQLDVRAEDVTVATNDFFRFRIPHNQLLVWVLHCVELIEVAIKPRTTTCSTESNLTETPNFAHNIGSVLPCDHIHLIVALARHTQALIIG